MSGTFKVGEHVQSCKDSMLTREAFDVLFEAKEPALGKVMRDYGVCELVLKEYLWSFLNIKDMTVSLAEETMNLLSKRDENIGILAEAIDDCITEAVRKQIEEEERQAERGMSAFERFMKAGGSSVTGGPQNSGKTSMMRSMVEFMRIREMYLNSPKGNLAAVKYRTLFTAV